MLPEFRQHVAAIKPTMKTSNTPVIFQLNSLVTVMKRKETLADNSCIWLFSPSYYTTRHRPSSLFCYQLSHLFQGILDSPSTQYLLMFITLTFLASDVTTVTFFLCTAQENCPSSPGTGSQTLPQRWTGPTETDRELASNRDIANNNNRPVLINRLLF